MKINLKLMDRAEAVGQTLVMELIPGLPEDLSARQRSIFISEEAFGFLEPCIAACWPRYKNFGHWGTSRISIEVWLQISAKLTELADSLHKSQNAGSVVGIGYIFSEVREHFSEEYSSIQPKLIRMILKLKDWIDKAAIGIEYITIVGV